MKGLCDSIHKRYHYCCQFSLALSFSAMAWELRRLPLFNLSQAVVNEARRVVVGKKPLSNRGELDLILVLVAEDCFGTIEKCVHSGAFRWVIGVEVCRLLCRQKVDKFRRENVYLVERNTLVLGQLM